MIKIKKKIKMNKIKKIILIVISFMFAANILLATTDCKKYASLLTIKKYNKCKAGVDMNQTSKNETSVKKMFKLNTNSKLFKTGKYSKNK